MSTAKSRNHEYLTVLHDIYNVSEELGLRAYVWGGFAVDTLYGSFTRDHGDVDCFTTNLHENVDKLTALYQTLGYEVTYLPDFWMMVIKKDGLSATFNSVKNVGGIANWYHAGERGVVYFPFEWLDAAPRKLYGTPVYTLGIEMAYILKKNVRLINPKWEPRKRDKADIAILEQVIAAQGVCKETILTKVWSHNPYWYAQGFEDYSMPITLV